MIKDDQRVVRRVQQLMLKSKLTALQPVEHDADTVTGDK